RRIALRSRFTETKRCVGGVRFPVDTPSATANMAPLRLAPKLRGLETVGQAWREVGVPQVWSDTTTLRLPAAPPLWTEGASWMSPKPCATTSAARAAAALFGAGFLCAIAVLGSACEDKAIGRPCDVQSDAGAMQA